MKTFWTNLPLTIRAAVIFCYAYAAVRILNLFYEAGTAPLTPRTLLDGALHCGCRRRCSRPVSG